MSQPSQGERSEIGRKTRIRLVHWNAAEAEERAHRLREAGFDVDADVPRSGGFFRDLGKSLPDVLVIDLGRLPSQGRDVAVGIRHQKSTRKVPIVMVDGDPVKVAAVRALLPDLIFAPWDEIAAAIEKARAATPGEGPIPKSRMEAYAGVPLQKKLGIKPGQVVALQGAPPDFQGDLGALPEGTSLAEGMRGAFHMALWFVRSTRELRDGIATAVAAVGPLPLWICWPKRGKEPFSDVTQHVIREVGMARGLVDYKICAINKSWSGLLFRKRKPGND